MFELVKVDPSPLEPNSFNLQQEALLHGKLAPQRNLAPRAQDSLPRQPRNLV